MTLSSLNPSIIAFLHNLKGWELLIIVFAILLLFGAKRLPELARGMGKSIKEFKKAATEAEDSFKTAMETESPSKKEDKTESHTS